MAKPKKAAGAKATKKAAAKADTDVVRSAEAEEAELPDEESGVEAGEGEEVKEPAPEPPRRRLVAELLEGQEVMEESSRPGLQLVAPPLHLETIDAGQPIYQLDLSSAEPRGAMVEREQRPDAEGADVIDPYDFPVPVEGDAESTIKAMIMQRDRQIMAAERDGLSAYELAAGLETFVRSILEIARRGR